MPALLASAQLELIHALTAEPIGSVQRLASEVTLEFSKQLDCRKFQYCKLHGLSYAEAYPAMRHVESSSLT